MDFLGIGPTEFIFVVIIMLIVLGPKDTVKTWRKLGEMLRSLINHPMFRQVQDARKDLTKLGDKILKETGAEELKETIGKDMKAFQDEAKKIREATSFEIHTDETKAQTPSPPKPVKPAASPDTNGMSAWTTPPSKEDAAEPGSESFPSIAPPNPQDAGEEQ